MSYFNFGKPKWYKLLPEHFQPTDNVTDRVEKLRLYYELDHDLIANLVVMTPWSVKKLQWYMLKKFNLESPHLSKKELWSAVIISRMNVKLMSLEMPIDEESTPLSRDEILKIIKNVQSVVKNFSKFDEVVDYIIDIDYKENRFFDNIGLLTELSNVLENKLN